MLVARGIAITDGQRYELLLEAAKALAFLHRTGVCVGDISPKNLLFSLQPTPAVYFIDCDAMRVNGVSALPQVETPEWEVPAGEQLATIQSDTYKLGLLALRLLAGDQHTKSPQQLPQSTPRFLRQLITDTLTTTPDRRPLPEAWSYLLAQVVEEAQPRALSPPTPTPTQPAPTHTAEPLPLVRSRDTTTPAENGVAAQSIKPPAPIVQATKSPRSKAIWITASAALVAVLVGVVLLATYSNGGSSQSPRAIFDGTFTATYGSQTNAAGKPISYSDDGSATLTWVVRSACDGDNCVATAKTVDRPGGQIEATFDLVDGRWLAVYRRTDPEGCANASDFWVTFSLESSSSTSLSGNLRGAWADGARCLTSGPVTFTRTGDADPDVETSDPAAQPRRVQSPAQALFGRYRYVAAYTTGETFKFDFNGRTDCLRSGQACLGYFHDSDGRNSVALILTDGQFESSASTEGKKCTDGAAYRSDFQSHWPLPQPPQDPITSLRGDGTRLDTGGCTGSGQFSVTMTRVGS